MATLKSEFLDYSTSNTRSQDYERLERNIAKLDGNGRELQRCIDQLVPKIVQTEALQKVLPSTLQTAIIDPLVQRVSEMEARLVAGLSTIGGGDR